MEDLHFLCLKVIHTDFKTVDFLHTNTQSYTNYACSSWIIFLLPQSLLRIFFHNQTHRASISFQFLETQGSTMDAIYGLLLLSRTPQDGIDTTVCFLCICKNCEIKL